MAKEITFAAQADRIKNKYKKGLENNDVFVVKSYNREMDRLMQEQEDYKAMNGFTEGETDRKFSAGGLLNAQLAEERNKRGRDLSMSDARAILGDKFPIWEAWIKPKLDSLRGANETNTDFNNMIYGDKFSKLEDTEPTPSKPQYEPTDRTYVPNPNYVPYKTNPLYDIASTGIAASSMLARDKASPISFDRVGTNYVDYDPARIDIKQQLDEGRIDALNSIRNAGGTRGQQLRAMANVSNAVADREAKALSDSYMQQYNQNAGIKTETDAMNADIMAKERLQNYGDKRYVLEHNNSRATELANVLQRLPQKLKDNMQRDYIMNTSSINYGYDKNGNIVNKFIPREDTVAVTSPTIAPEGLPTTVYNAHGDIWGKEQYTNPFMAYTDKAPDLTKYKNGGKLRKYKCGGKLKK